MTTTDEKEWLQFMEFIRRKYGNNSSDFIRINDYNNRDSNSVAAYYKTKYPTENINININDNLEMLLKNQSFTNLFKLNDPVEVTKFTEIYSDTDSLMQKLNLNTRPLEDLYINCNPSDSTAGNGYPDESTTTSGGSASSTTNLEISPPEISPPDMYNDVVSHIVISILILVVVLFIGYLLTSYFPERVKNAALIAYRTLQQVQTSSIKLGIAKSVLRNIPPIKKTIN